MTETTTERAGLEKMTVGERDAYYAQIEKWLRDGKTDGWIQRELGISRHTARRHLSFVKGRMGKALAIPTTPDTTIDAHPAVAGRQIPVELNEILAVA